MIDFVATWSAETELSATRVLGWLRLGASKYFDWKQRYGKANEHNAMVPRDQAGEVGAGGDRGLRAPARED